jgi:hypothetical protein
MAGAALLEEQLDYSVRSSAGINAFKSARVMQIGTEYLF